MDSLPAEMSYGESGARPRVDSSTANGLQAKQIMLVEDEFLFAMDLKQRLLGRGYAVPAMVASGEEAVRQALMLKPDLILMDIALDGAMTGIEAATEIRRVQDIPIVYLSAHVDAGTMEMAKQTEPLGFLSKPCNLATMVSTIEMALHKSGADAARREAEKALRQERLAHEQALAKSEEKYRLVAEFTHDWEFWLGPEESILYCSPSCHKITGYAVTAFESDPGLLRRIVHPDDLAGYDQHRHGSQALKMEGDLEFRILHADGSVRWISHVCQPVFSAKGEYLGTRGSHRDISQRKTLEAELNKNRNLEALGTLAGGIAHDFNNLFQVLFGNISLAKMCLPQGSEAGNYLLKAEQVYGQATKLTNQFVAFSTGGSAMPTDLHLTTFVPKAVTTILAASDCALEFDLAHDLWLVHADPVQLRQVLECLVTNAREAMPAGGGIFVTARNESIPEGKRRGNTLTPGNYVVISIRDQGRGINNEDLPRIFDPYFSTKPRGAQKGMGLGLSLCNTIIRKHGGMITVETGPGLGATFHVHLPAVTMDSVERTITTESMGEGPRILIMDDETAVTEVASKYLTLSGYRVDSVTNGEAAVAAFQEARAAADPYAAVILDLVIPGGMGGEEVCALLKEVDPQARVVISSGNIHAPAILDFADHGFVEALVKPYQLKAMKAMLERMV